MRRNQLSAVDVATPQGVKSTKRKANSFGIPEHELEALARVLIPELEKYFESEEGQREFAEWKAQQSDSNYNYN